MNLYKNQPIKKQILTKPNINTSSINKSVTPNLTVDDNISAEMVVNSLNGFKKSIVNLQYLINLVKINSTNIKNWLDDRSGKTNAYVEILKPIVDTDINYMDSNINHFWISYISTNNTDAYGDFVLPFFQGKYSKFNNFKAKDINASNFSFLLNNNIPSNYYTDKLIELNEFYKTLLNKKLLENPNLEYFYDFRLFGWDDGINLYSIYVQKDIIDNKRWIMLVSNISLSKYNISNASYNTTLDDFSINYQGFLTNIMNVFDNLQSNNWENVTDIFQYNPSNFLNAICISSATYPEWNGKPIITLSIPNSLISISQYIGNITKDLSLNYPNLQPGNIAFSVYTIGEKYYLSLIKLDILNGLKVFKEKQILINDYFAPKLTVPGDTIIKGSLDVQSNNGTHILQTDNVNKVTSIQTKLGINKSVDRVNAMLDIDNFSNSKFMDILTEFKETMIDSYNILNYIRPEIDELGYYKKFDENLTNLPIIYKQKGLIFKINIKNLIDFSDISFLSIPDKLNPTFSESSFKILQRNINEINKMTEIQYKPSFIFTFIELLNDTKYTYLCCLRGIVVNNIMYIVMSFKDVNTTVINPSTKENFTTLCEILSGCSRYNNYGCLLLHNTDICENSKMNTKSNFTSVVNNSPFYNRFGSGTYIFAVEYEPLNVEEVKYLLHQVNTHWNDKQVKNLYLPGTDVAVLNAVKTIVKAYETKFSSFIDQNFLVSYDWNNGYKVSFVNVQYIQGKRFIVGAGVDLATFITKSSIITGDIKFTGDFLMTDNTGRNIFQIDTVQNKTVNMYNFGVGTENPKTMLDIKDSGLSDIISMVTDYSIKLNNLFLNTNLVQNWLINQSENINDVFNNFKNKDGNIIQQYDESYYALIQYSSDFIPKNFKVLYHKLYPNWINNTYNDILTKNLDVYNNPSVNYAITFSNNSLTHLINENVSYYLVYDWVNGKKLGLQKIFKHNNIFFKLCTGINFQAVFDLKYVTNYNINTFFKHIEMYQRYLYTLVLIQKNIDITTLPNYSLYNNYMIQNVKIVPKMMNSDGIYIYKKYTINTSKKYVSNIDIYNYESMTKISTINLNDINEAIKADSFLINLSKNFNTPNTKYGLLSLIENEYNMICFEDSIEDFLSLFYVTKVDIVNNVIELISLEINLTKMLISSLSVHGDALIEGDLTIKSPDTNNSFIAVDSGEQYFGVDTNIRYTKYSGKYTSLTSNEYSVSKNHMVVANTRYPNCVFERIAETTDPSLFSRYLASYSSATMRRKSNLYTFEQINNSIKDNTSNNKYNYGSDISFEISDKSGLTTEIGNVGFVIDKYRTPQQMVETGEFDQITGAFLVCIPNYKNDPTWKRDLMRINSDGCVFVDKIRLGSMDEKGNSVPEKGYELSAKPNPLDNNKIWLYFGNTAVAPHS